MAKDKGLVERVSDAARGAVEKVGSEASRLLGGGDTVIEPPVDQRQQAALSDYERALTNVVVVFAAFPKAGPYSLRFADGETFLDGEQIVAAVELRDDGNGRVTYGKPIDFAPESPAGRISEAWLIAGSGEAMRCDLGNPGLDVGAGRSARIPAGHLLF